MSITKGGHTIQEKGCLKRILRQRNVFLEENQNPASSWQTNKKLHRPVSTFFHDLSLHHVPLDACDGPPAPAVLPLVHIAGLPLPEFATTSCLFLFSCLLFQVCALCSRPQNLEKGFCTRKFRKSFMTNQKHKKRRCKFGSRDHLQEEMASELRTRTEVGAAKPFGRPPKLRLVQVVLAAYIGAGG